MTEVDCTLFRNDFFNQPADGAFLDSNWRCRVCQKLAGRHPLPPIAATGIDPDAPIVGIEPPVGIIPKPIRRKKATSTDDAGKKFAVFMPSCILLMTKVYC